MGFLIPVNRATHPKVAITPKHARRKIASMCSKEKNGPSCAKAEAEVKNVIKRITDLIEVPSVNVVSRFLRPNRWKGFS